VPAVAQAARILLYFAKNDIGKANLTEICQSLGLYKSRGYTILKTLAEYGFIERDEATKRYSLGSTLMQLSRKFLKHLDIREKALPYLEKLADETKCTALLGIISDEHLVVIAKKDGNTHLGITIEIGHRFHLTAGAHGKAIVAFLPEEEQRMILKRKKLYFYGNPDNFDRSRFDEDVKSCLKTGYALDMGDLQTGIHAVAAPVFTGNGKITGALIVIGTFPKKKAADIGLRLRDAAGKISTAMGAEMPKLFKNLSSKLKAQS
jgi:DNA-binding IclR family transcriptional regulator